MQNTRLNRLFDTIGGQLDQWLQNPWRRISLLLISLLFGTFVGTALSTIAGQAADWDVVAAGVLLLFIEMANRIVYGRNPRMTRSLWVEMLNSFKIGVTYNLFVEAFKLGS
ncbi:MAG: DUF565 domain-containing protein [Actinomycetota bacterium]